MDALFTKRLNSTLPAAGFPVYSWLFSVVESVLFCTFLDTQSNPHVDTAGEEFGMYHGVRVYSCTRMPVTTETVEETKTKTTVTDALLMVRGAVAQPVVVNQYGDPEKIQLSNDYAVSLFYDYGTKALTPDLIFKLQTSTTA